MELADNIEEVSSYRDDYFCVIADKLFEVSSIELNTNCFSIFEQIKTTCHFCSKKAVFSLKHVNGKADCTGPSVQLGAIEKYFATCADCYRTKLLI